MKKEEIQGDKKKEMHFLAAEKARKEKAKAAGTDKIC